MSCRGDTERGQVSKGRQQGITDLGPVDRGRGAIYSRGIKPFISDLTHFFGMKEVNPIFFRGGRREGLDQDETGRILMFDMKSNLMRRKRNGLTFRYFEFYCEDYTFLSKAHEIGDAFCSPRF